MMGGEIKLCLIVYEEKETLKANEFTDAILRPLKGTVT